MASYVPGKRCHTRPHIWPSKHSWLWGSKGFPNPWGVDGPSQRPFSFHPGTSPDSANGRKIAERSSWRGQPRSN